MAFIETNYAKKVLKALEDIGKQLKRIADALENQQQPEEIKQPEKITRTYRDVIKERLPHRVSEDYGGGVHGCPDNYFGGAPRPERCTGGLCAQCWDRPYQGEELILE